MNWLVSWRANIPALLTCRTISLVGLRSLCEKGRARPPPELARLFALDKFIFWRVLAFWRTDRDLEHHITTHEREPPINEYFD